MTVAGNTVQPLRPIASRPTYAAGFVGGTRAGTNPGTAGGVRYGYIQSPNAVVYGRQGYGNGAVRVRAGACILWRLWGSPLCAKPRV